MLFSLDVLNFNFKWYLAVAKALLLAVFLLINRRFFSQISSISTVPVVFFFLHSEQLPHYRRELYDPFNRTCCIYRHLITGYHVHGQILDVKKGFSDGYPVVHPYKTRPHGIPEALKFKITSKHGFLKGERILNLAPLFPFNSSREPRADPAFMKKILKKAYFHLPCPEPRGRT